MYSRRGSSGGADRLRLGLYRPQWPQRLERWTNLSADNDVVALEKKLAPLFDDRIVDLRIDNEARAHDVSPYLTDAATGAAVADGVG